MVVGEIVSSAEPRFKAIGPGDRYCLLLRPCVNRVGRHNDVYVLSDVTFGDTGDELIVPSSRTFSADMGTRGSLQDWRKNVGRLCEVNPLPSLLSHGHAGGAHFMSFNSGVALELLGSYSYYTSTTTEYLRDKPVVAEIARRAFPGAAISEVKSGANANEKTLYDFSSMQLDRSRAFSEYVESDCALLGFSKLGNCDSLGTRFWVLRR